MLVFPAMAASQEATDPSDDEPERSRPVFDEGKLLATSGVSDGFGAESDPGNAIDVEFTASGTFDVFCHIHPKMNLHVTVQ